MCGREFFFSIKEKSKWKVNAAGLSLMRFIAFQNEAPQEFPLEELTT